ncbi:MAG: NAD(P)-dependent oxidoreductase [Bacteroidales bacterium]|jgi:dTDP-4-dehydrorhamnose reductase
MARILLFGASGQLGADLSFVLTDIKHVVKKGSYRKTHFGDNACAFTEYQKQSLIDQITYSKPDVIINAAGYNNVDGAEFNQDEAYSFNADAVKVLGEQAKQNKCLLIHYSTNFVFDGKRRSERENKSNLYSEDDKPNPINIYGDSKLRGDQFLLEMSAPAIILRTSWLMSLKNKNNFMRRILNKAQSYEDIEVVDDQFAVPTLSYDLSKLTVEIINRVLSDKNPDSYYGIHNVTNFITAGTCRSCGGISKFDVATDILKAYKKACLTDLYLPTYSFIPYGSSCIGISSSDARLPCGLLYSAKRPSHTALDCQKLYNTFRVRMPEWTESLNREISNYYFVKNYLNRFKQYESSQGV